MGSLRSRVRLIFGLACVVALGPSATGAGDLPLEDDMILQRWAAIELGQLKSKSLFRSGVDEQRAKVRERAEESRMKMLWLRAEGHNFARLASDILHDTETARRRQDKLREASESATRFTQWGIEVPRYRVKFLDLVMMTAYRGEVREGMAKEIEAIAPEDFAGHRLFGIVLPGGDLEPPPSSLLEKSVDGDGEALFRRFRDDWLDAASALRRGSKPDVERLETMWSVLDEWENSLIDGRELPSPAAVAYLDNARRLVAGVGSPGERTDVTAFLRDGGHRFGGGTYGDLLFFVLKHRLYPKAGTPGSLAIAELTQAMVERAEVEIAALDEELERLKRQSPAHNAVLRERMVPRYFADKSSVGIHAGLNSPAYEQ